MDMSQYISMFLEESRENLQNLNDYLLALENQPNDRETIDQIFRVAHTLKGMSATMGFTEMSDLTHEMENILDMFRGGQLEITPEVITVLFQCLDMLSQMVEDISEGILEGHDTSELVKKLNMLSKAQEEVAPTATLATEQSRDAILELNDYEQTIIKNAQQRDYSIYHISVHLSEDCLIKSARAFLVIKNLEEKGEIIKALPTVDKLEDEEFEHSFQLLFITKERAKDLESLILGISEVQSVEVAPFKMEDSQREEKPLKNSFMHKSKINQSVRVDIHRLDNFMNLVSELVISRTRLEQISHSHRLKDLHETLEQVARITTDLQDLVLKIRMLPIDRVFNRFPRMVRDLSQELGKEIELVIEGQDTELDRTVIDELGDPLVHLIRNAVDHGIEPREERIKKGKNPKGKVMMIAYQEGNKAIIRIEDDGKGIDPGRIRQKAMEKGMAVEDLSDEEVIYLIFQQGFSTNEMVTDVSGRGVGMDVVKEKIHSLGGNISLRSEVDKGSAFIIDLPLTLSIIQALLVKVAKETFAISLGFIEKVVSVTQEDIRGSHNGEIFIYRGHAIPVIRVNEKLNLPRESREEQYLIIVRVGEKNFGLMVDELIGQQEIVIKPLGKSLKDVKDFVGATILGDGLVTLILDAGAMI